MSNKPVKSLTSEEHAQLCCTYAALILHDDNQEVNANQMQKLIKAAGNNVESFWSKLFAKALQGKNIDNLLTSTDGASAQTNTSVAGETKTETKAESKADNKKEVKKEEKVEEEEDMDMGDLFG